MWSASAVCGAACSSSCPCVPVGYARKSLHAGLSIQAHSSVLLYRAMSTSSSAGGGGAGWSAASFNRISAASFQGASR
eukprot:5659567-Pyramimonas_sp.AAC.1